MRTNYPTTDERIVSAEGTPVLHIYELCKRHKLLPRLSKDKKRWFLRPMPKVKATVLPLFESRD